jgi:hypothetical protein
VEAPAAAPASVCVAALLPGLLAAGLPRFWPLLPPAPAGPAITTTLMLQGKQRQGQGKDSLSLSLSEIDRMRDYCPRGLCCACELACMLPHSLTHSLTHSLPPNKPQDRSNALRSLPLLGVFSGFFRFLPHKLPIVLSWSEVPEYSPPSINVRLWSKKFLAFTVHSR